MTAAQFFGVLVIGFLLGVAFAAWRQVAYEARLRAYREQWSPPLGSPLTEEERGSLRKPW